MLLVAASLSTLAGEPTRSAPKLSTLKIDKESIEKELKEIASSSRSSVDRLSRVAKLTDAMADANLSPSLQQLKALLVNDVTEIRMHASDWFQLSPPKEIGEKADFLRLALKTKPYQVRERAYGAVLSFSPSDIRDLKKAGVLNFESCRSEAQSSIQDLCRLIESKASSGKP